MKNLRFELVIFKTKPTKPEEIVNDFNPAEDGEASEKAHCASYQTQLGLHGHLEYWLLIMTQQERFDVDYKFKISSATFTSLSISS